MQLSGYHDKHCLNSNDEPVNKQLLRKKFLASNQIRYNCFAANMNEATNLFSNF